MDIEQARFNMIEQQIRPWEVLDQKVLDLLSVVRREDFVPEEWRALAFADLEVPIGHGERMWFPRVEARCVQELALHHGERVLEVGTGSGYLTALMARLAGHVYSVEIEPALSESAGARLAAHGVRNVTLEVGDAARGWSAHGPYDAIVLTGSVPVLPQAFLDSLALGGRLFVVEGDEPVMTAALLTCIAPGRFSRRGLFETCLKPLRNALQPERFAF